MMNTNDHTSLDSLLADLSEPFDDLAMPPETASAQEKTTRQLNPMLRKIPVVLSLEVGTARVTLQDVMDIAQDSIIELDTLAGEPLTIKVNGAIIGRAEVVVSGENYALKVVELADMDLGRLTS